MLIGETRKRKKWRRNRRRDREESDKGTHLLKVEGIFQGRAYVKWRILTGIFWICAKLRMNRSFGSAPPWCPGRSSKCWLEAIFGCVAVCSCVFGKKFCLGACLFVSGGYFCLLILSMHTLKPPRPISITKRKLHFLRCLHSYSNFYFYNFSLYFQKHSKFQVSPLNFSSWGRDLHFMVTS